MRYAAGVPVALVTNASMCTEQSPQCLPTSVLSRIYWRGVLFVFEPILEPLQIAPVYRIAVGGLPFYVILAFKHMHLYGLAKLLQRRYAM